MIQVYLDAKRLNLPAYSWPSRYVAGEASFAYDSLNQSRSIIAQNIDLQYVNPPGHLNLMTAIVHSHREEFLRKINDCIALSSRINGSIDFTHIDKIYVMAKLINSDGSSELIFIGIAEQTQRLAIGLMAAVMEALKTAVNDPKLILRKTSSVCTDGTNVNSGDKSGLWVLEIQSIGSEIPFTKVWCAAHRAELVWKDMAKSVPEVSKAFSVLSKMSSYFHSSGLRTAELKKIATDRNLRLLMLPKNFEIRWSQFTFDLLRSVLISWNALVIYFIQNGNDADCAGYLNYLTKLHTLQLVAFLADVLFAFSRFQKQLQSDQLTFITMKSHITSVLNNMNSMRNCKLPGGFESNLASQVIHEEDEDKFFLKSIELQTARPSRRATANSTLDFTDLRENILNAICNFLTDRFEVEENLLKKITPFIIFSPDTNIEEVHSTLAPDLSLPNLYMQFNDFTNVDSMKDMSLNEIIVKLCKTAESRDTNKELITVLARIAACTPHSADVERMISANNRLKTKLRSSISIETENKYINIHTNMPVLAN